MIGMDHALKGSWRAYRVRFAPVSGLIADIPDRQLVPRSRHADEARPRYASGYSILRPSLLTNARHLPSSRSMLAAYSSGVLGMGPPPSEIRRNFTSSELTIWRSSLLSCWTIAGDVPLGASSP